MRLRTMSPHQPGWTRRRAGRGFSYLDETGHRLPSTDIERIRALAIPPAWTDVWISPAPNGHLQAVGTDSAGRRQYLYHPQWRIQRDAAKFDRVLQLAKRLPASRDIVLDDLAGAELSRARVLAASVRLIDLGCFRIGNDFYADEYGSYGLTTLERRHVRLYKDGFVFDFVGKSGIRHHIEVVDRPVCAVLRLLRRRRASDARLLAYRDGRNWHPLGANDVNDYLHTSFDADMTAKDFRTWHATVLAATALAQAGPATTTRARKQAVKQAVEQVADYLGNTPTVARGSYIDPRVIDLYEDGVTIAARLPKRMRDPDRRRERIEKAVLRMLTHAPTVVRRSA